MALRSGRGRSFGPEQNNSFWDSKRAKLPPDRFGFTHPTQPIRIGVSGSTTTTQGIYLQDVYGQWSAGTGETFGDLNLKQSPHVYGVGIDSTEAFGTLNISLYTTIWLVGTPNASDITFLTYASRAIGIDSAEVFGNTTAINNGGGVATKFIQPSGIVSTEVFGSVTTSFKTKLTGITSVEAFGVTQINLRTRTIGIASNEAFGTLRVLSVIKPVSINSTESFGTARIAGSSTAILLTGITSQEVFGTLTARSSVTVVVPISIGSAEAIGVPRVNETLRAVGIATAEAFGVAGLPKDASPVGIASTEVFGTPKLKYVVYASGIPTAEGFGNVSILVAAAQTVSTIGIQSGESFGTPNVGLNDSPVRLRPRIRVGGSGNKSKKGAPPEQVTILTVEAHLLTVNECDTVRAVSGRSRVILSNSERQPKIKLLEHRAHTCESEIVISVYRKCDSCGSVIHHT